MMTILKADRDHYIENVCSKCPGCLWGKKSICRVHNIHVSEVEVCPEWVQHESSDRTEHDKRLPMFDLEPAVEVVQKVESDLRNYRWMKVRIHQLRRELGDAGERVTRQYGIDSVMPKSKGRPADPVHREVSKREKDWDRLRKLEAKVANIEQFLVNLQDDLEREVLECILDGWRMKDLAVHINKSRQRLNEIKRSLVQRLAQEMYRNELKWPL